MRRSVLSNVVIGLLTVAIVIGAFASFQRKRSSFERIDFTFRRNNGVIVVKTVDPGSGAEASGLKPGDAIWLIGDTPTTKSKDCRRRFAASDRPYRCSSSAAGKRSRSTTARPS